MTGLPSTVKLSQLRNATGMGCKLDEFIVVVPRAVQPLVGRVVQERFKHRRCLDHAHRGSVRVCIDLFEIGCTGVDKREYQPADYSEFYLFHVFSVIN